MSNIFKWIWQKLFQRKKKEDVIQIEMTQEAIVEETGLPEIEVQESGFQEAAAKEEITQTATAEAGMQGGAIQEEIIQKEAAQKEAAQEEVTQEEAVQEKSAEVADQGTEWISYLDEIEKEEMPEASPVEETLEEPEQCLKEDAPQAEAVYEPEQLKGEASEADILTNEVVVEEAATTLTAASVAAYEDRKLEDLLLTKGSEKKLVLILEKLGICTTSELTAEAIAVTKTVPGISEVKYKQFWEKFKGYADDKLLIGEVFSEEEWMQLETAKCWKVIITIHPVHQARRIDDVFSENTYASLRKYSEEVGIACLGQIEQTFLDGYREAPGVGAKKYENVIERLKNYISEEGESADEMTPQSIFTEYRLNPKKERLLAVLNYRFKEGYTLEKTGEIFGCTRERVRQIQKKALHEVGCKLKESRLTEMLLERNQGNHIVQLDLLMEVVGEDNEYIINMVLSNAFEEIYYSQIFNKLILTDQVTEAEILQSIEEALPAHFEIDEYIELIGSQIERLGIVDWGQNEVTNLLLKLGYRKYGQFYGKGTMTIIMLLDLIFRNEIEAPIYMDEAAAQYIVELARNKYDFELQPNIRAIETRMRDNKEIILVDSRTYLHRSKLPYTTEMLNRIKVCLEELFKVKSIVNAGEVYEALKEDFKDTCIQNKYSLYALISYHFDETYNVGEGNTLNIYVDHTASGISRKDLLKAAVEKHDGIAYKDVIAQELGWELNKVEDTICKSREMLSWNGIQVRHSSAVSGLEEMKEVLKQVIEDELQKGYLVVQHVFDKLHSEHREFMFSNEIGCKNTLASLLKYVDETLLGHTYFLYRTTSKVKQIEEIVANQFKERVNRQELMKFLEAFGYRESSILNIMNNLIKVEALVEVDQENFVVAETLEINPEFAKAFVQMAERQMEGQDYIIIDTLEPAEGLEPGDGYVYNKYLGKTILRKNGFKVLERFNRDYRYDIIVMTKAEKSHLENFEDLVYELLKNEYEGIMQQIHIYEYLEAKGLTRKQAYNIDKRLPYGVRMHEKINIDENGIVEIIN